MLAGGKGKARVTLGVIRGNPESVERLKMAVQLQNPVVDHLPAYIQENRSLFDRPDVAQPDCKIGRTLAICGAGPSLRDAVIRTDDVWACNSAATYLESVNIPYDFAVGIDQTPGLLKEWATAPLAPFLLASSVDPKLVKHLQALGRRLVFFHNMVGVDNEIGLYKQWPSTFMVTAGYSVVSRVINLAQWMGYDRIELHGVDCEFGPDDLAHANGDSANDAYGKPMVFEHTYENGRHSRTRMDMLMDAVYLARLARAYPGHIELMGDTLPAMLKDKPDDFLDQVCRQLPPVDADALTKPAA